MKQHTKTRLSDHPARLELHVRGEVYNYPLPGWPVNKAYLDNAKGAFTQQHVKEDEPYEIYLIIQSKANKDLKA